jgi:hypothetical protein
MTYLVLLSYQYPNGLGFNHLIYPKLKANLWLNPDQVFPFTIDKILSNQSFIMPNTQAEITLITSTHEVLPTDTIYEWGLDFTPIGKAKIIHLLP